MSPIIVIGMHRSGTTLVTKLLLKLGLYSGHRLMKNREARYFQGLNRRLLARAGGSWSEPEPVMEAMRSQAFVEEQVALVEQELLERDGLLDFFRGDGRYRTFLQGYFGVWGWKDPRNTLALPIWLRIFPRARLLHVVRNGVDVAISLHRREIARPIPSNRACYDFGYCFHLWELYLQAALDFKSLARPQRYLELKYEDLLSDPERALRPVISFMGLSPSKSRLHRAITDIDRGRLDNLAFARPYWEKIARVSDLDFMKYYGYSYQEPHDPRSAEERGA